MTAGDMLRPVSQRQLTRERLLHSHQTRSTRQMNRRAAILFLGLTIVWLAVLWMAIFGSRPHTYFLILVGTYTVGVLSGSGISTFVFGRGFSSRAPAETPAEPVDAEIRPVS